MRTDWTLDVINIYLLLILSDTAVTTVVNKINA